MGNHKYIGDPDEFIRMWDEFKKEIDSNPDYIEKATNKGIQKERVPRPYTRQGFEAFVYRNYGFNIRQYIDNDRGDYEEFIGVVTCVRNEWENNQISGTLTGQYKAQTLVARLNGYSDKHEHTVKPEEPLYPDVQE